MMTLGVGALRPLTPLWMTRTLGGRALERTLILGAGLSLRADWDALASPPPEKRMGRGRGKKVRYRPAGGEWKGNRGRDGRAPTVHPLPSRLSMSAKRGAWCSCGFPPPASLPLFFPPALCPLCPLWLESLPRPTRKFFPIIGKCTKNFSNHWKNRGVFSNHWKIVFQSLENGRVGGELADCTGGGRAFGADEKLKG